MSNPDSNLEAKRWFEVAEKLLEARDLHGSRRFAKKAQESDPRIDGVDQILAIIDVLLASDKRINKIHLDWYAVLQLDRRDVDLDQIKRQYKKLALLLHPDKNKFALAGNAFKLICDASSYLSDSVKRSVYDSQINLSTRFTPIVMNNHNHPPQPQPQPKRKYTRTAPSPPPPPPAPAPPTPTPTVEVESFWTVCPYCYYLYEYPRIYYDCCLRCQNCRKAFHGAEVQSPPPPVGDVKDFYYCTWAFFPVGCTMDNDLIKSSSWTLPGEPNVGETKEPIDSKDDLGSNFSGANVGMSREDGCGATRTENHKAARFKTTARKTVVSRPKSMARKFTTEAHGEKMIEEEKIIPEWVGMDLNLEINETEEPRKAAAAGVEIQGIDSEATQGIGFFEGLDSLIGNLAP